MLAVVIALVVKTFVAQAFFIPSGSMLPQLEPGDRVVVSKLAYRLHAPRRGDVVVFDSPTPVHRPRPAWPVRVVRSVLQAVGLVPPSTQEFIKRVIALPGERVEGRNGHVYVDGRLVVEPYLPSATTTPDFRATVVPAGRLWVMGDNRANSADSRSFGAIRRSTVVGRAFVRVWPVGESAFL